MIGPVIRRHIAVLLACAGVAAALLAPVLLAAQSPPPATTDSLYRHAQHLVNTGHAAEGRALVDSLFQTTQDGTRARAEALHWRATLAPDSVSAERDFLVLAIDYELSPRAADALLRLGRTAFTRGDRESAALYLERLVLGHRLREAATDGWYWLARTRLATGDLAAGCVALDSAQRRVASTNIERRNQISFAAQACRNLPDSARRAGTNAGANSGANAGAGANTGADSGAGATRAAPPPTAPVRAADTLASAAVRWSVQAGAYRTQADADRQVASLKARGHTARVDHLTLYHVRIGAYKTRAEAASLVTRLRAQGITAFVVEAPARDR